MTQQRFLIMVRRDKRFGIQFLKQINQFKIEFTERFSLAQKFKNHDEIDQAMATVLPEMTTFKVWDVCDL